MVGYTVSAQVAEATLVSLLQSIRGYGLVRRLEAIAWFVAPGAVAIGAVAAGAAALYDPRQANTPQPATSPELVQSWEAGRIFNADVEWRWERSPQAGYRLLGLSEAQRHLAPVAGRLATWEVVQPQKSEAHLLLSGSAGGEGKPWRETRYPTALVYPLQDLRSEGKPRPPVLRYLEYRDTNSQRVQFLRLTGMG